MFDNTIMSISNITRNDFDSVLGKLHKFEIVKQKENVIKVKWFNMLLVYYPNSNYLEIKNSVHKLYNMKFGNGQPDNSTDFTLSQFVLTAKFIAEIFETDASEISIHGRFEFGVNIEKEGAKPYDIIERYMSYKSVQQNPFVTIPPRNGKPKERCCYLSDYRLKAYYKDYLYDVGIPSEKGVLRYEVVTTQLRMLRKITGLDVIKLKDLCEKGFNEQLGKSIIETYDKIEKIPLLAEGISQDELSIIHNHCNSLYYKDVKRGLLEQGLKQLRERQKSIYEKWDKAEGNIHNVVRNKILEKVNYLVSN